ncbi:hypothetical protein ADUPG1_012601 [Aduncisulcus paluster]|uniref:Uncharacterized protein n=1 Tax=Aduncisulcus paluster TaxID=2918883 RepID=A0ABQ5K227_9EUKA|nr:hypothetical protein ADUPG1_012601 [Aduncisulcus paluster]
MQGGLRLPLKVITEAVSVHHERKAVVMVRRDLFVGWEMDSVSWIDFDKFFSLYGSPDFDALSYSIPIPDDRLITPDEDSSLKKPPSRDDIPIDLLLGHSLYPYVSTNTVTMTQKDPFLHNPMDISITTDSYCLPNALPLVDYKLIDTLLVPMVEKKRMDPTSLKAMQEKQMEDHEQYDKEQEDLKPFMKLLEKYSAYICVKFNEQQTHISFFSSFPLFFPFLHFLMEV